MKTVAGAFLVALILVAAGVVCVRESNVTRGAADVYARLATLDYEGELDDGASSILSRLPLPISSEEEVAVERARTDYWLARYEALTPLTGAGGTRPADNPNLLFIAANAAYRASHPEAGTPTAAVDRLDSVLQVYAEVLRRDPGYIDAAYNYEYISRLRDRVARGRGVPKPAADPNAPVLGGDLPAGPTLHGRPGGKPPETPMNEFRTIVPMPEERLDQTEGRPGQGGPRRRRG
jgi:hypothetical protein